MLVVCAFRRPVDRLELICKHAEARGATTILISDLTGLNVRPRPAVLLAASRGPEGESQSLTVPMAICNALILELSRLDGGRSLQALEDLAALARSLSGTANCKAEKESPNGTKRQARHAKAL